MTFLWQYPSIPFGFPHIGTPNENGKTLITYPTQTTQLLRLPWTKKMCEILGIAYAEQTRQDKKERANMKKVVEAQVMLGVLNY